MGTGDPTCVLPERDREYLEEKEIDYSVNQVDGFVHLVIHDFLFPEGYIPSTAELLIRLPAGYPNASPDMFWTAPDVRLSGGAWPRAAEVHEVYGGRSWQRWSRHFPGGWRPGIDGIHTYLGSIRSELRKPT